MSVALENIPASEGVRKVAPGEGERFDIRSLDLEGKRRRQRLCLFHLRADTWTRRRRSGPQSLVSGSLLHSHRTNRFLSHGGWEGRLVSLRDWIGGDPASELSTRFVQQVL